MVQKQNLDLRVYFIVDPELCGGRAPEDVVRAAIAGGITLLQYRDKSNDFPRILETAKRIQEITQWRVPFLINDHVEIAEVIDADGVHLGQGDMDAAEARRILGPDKIIGLTAFNAEQILAVDPAVVDYIGTGPVYPTQTDKGKPVLGPERFEKLVKLSPVPVVGIGGITPQNASAVRDAGAAGVAMMRAISGSADPKEAAADFLRF